MPEEEVTAGVISIKELKARAARARRAGQEPPSRERSGSTNSALSTTAENLACLKAEAAQAPEYDPGSLVINGEQSDTKPTLTKHAEIKK